MSRFILIVVFLTTFQTAQAETYTCPPMYHTACLEVCPKFPEEDQRACTETFWEENRDSFWEQHLVVRGEYGKAIGILFALNSIRASTDVETRRTSK